MKKAAFVISSPFQALCALEAKSYYGIDDATFFLFDTDICHNMVAPFLNKAGEIRFIEHKKNGTIQLIRKVRKSVKERFELVFCGDYFSYGIYVVALCISKYKSQHVYLDDGNSSLEIAPPISRKRPRSRNERLWYSVLNLFTKLKAIKSSLFTIYDLGDNCPMPVIHNSFSSLVSGDDILRHGIYVIGTNASKAVFRYKSYQEYLTAIDGWIKSKYREEEVYYCPHRGDHNDWSSFIDSLGWKMFETEISVEIDFVHKGLYPVGVFGFGSTALLTLKMIYPDSDVKTIVAEYASESDNRSYRRIEEYYLKYDIHPINL